MLRAIALTNPKLVTQMGNQGHSSEGARLINEWIRRGHLGAVHEVHVWTNRPVVYWPQGLPLPTGVRPSMSPAPIGNPWTYRHVQDVLADAHGRRRHAAGGARLGPLSRADRGRHVPYHPVYHPFNWRGWLDFGSGALGDMGAHLHRPSLLGARDSMYPTSIEATSTPWGTMAMAPLDPTAPAILRPGGRSADPCHFRSQPACTISLRRAASSRP